SLEWYFAPSSSAYVTWFERDVEGFVIDFRRMVQFEGEDYVMSQPYNASNGKLDGIEVGLIYFPENLPAALDGLGVQFSYTSLNSSQDIPGANNAGELIHIITQPIFSASGSSDSVVLAYDTDPFDARISYVWRDDCLNNYEQRQYPSPRSVYRKAETCLDLQITYDVTDNITLTFYNNNLTNEI